MLQLSKCALLDSGCVMRQLRGQERRERRSAHSRSTTITLPHRPTGFISIRGKRPGRRCSDTSRDSTHEASAKETRLPESEPMAQGVVSQEHCRLTDTGIPTGSFPPVRSRRSHPLSCGASEGHEAPHQSHITGRRGQSGESRQTDQSGCIALARATGLSGEFP